MFQIIFFSLISTVSSDSLRMETINGKQYVVHQVGEKETLFSLSRRYGSTVNEILEQNPAADGGLEVGQILKIPYSPRAKAQAVQTAAGTIHKVAPKETLFSIARLYNVSVDDIKSWNNLKDNALALGQEVLIKRKTETVPVEVKPVQPVSPSSAKTHTVAAKETMFSIARQYGMTVQQLKDWNSLQGNELKIGQVLSVVAPAPGQQPVTTPVTTTPTTTTIVTPTKPAQTETTIRISESVSGSDEVKETGLAELIEGTEGNRKYLAQHASVKPGTILKIRNVTTNQEVFVRVTGPPPVADPIVMIRISKSAYDRLGETLPRFRAEITYYK